jgi:DegV family protein with EDD domain
VTVGVVTDSAASLSPELAAELAVVVVPMLITVDDTTVPDDEMPLERLVRLLPHGVHTAGPTPGAFEEAIRRADQGDGVLVLTVSQGMSSTYKAALLAAEASDRQVRVLDTATAAGGEGLVVLAAARCASEGQRLGAVEARARTVIERVRLVAVVERLEQLARSGRLPEIARRAGDHIGVRPLFGFEAGRIRPLRPALSREKALEQTLSYWRRSRVEGADLHVAALHALDPAGAAWLLDQVSAEVRPATALVGTFGPVMVAHTGPGVTGLAWWWEEPSR